MQENKGKYLGTYEISRKPYYKKTFVVVAFMMAITYVVLNLYVSDNKVISGGVLTAGLFCLIGLAIPISQYFQHKFWLKAYDNGLEVYQLGFFVWEDIFIHQEKNKNSLVFRKGFIRNTELKWQPYLNARVVKFENWDDDSTSTAEHLFFLFNIPLHVTNISYNDFLKIFDTKIKISTPYDTITR